MLCFGRAGPFLSCLGLGGDCYAFVLFIAREVAVGQLIGFLRVTHLAMNGAQT